jgi:AraC family transcriptional regulator of arabinose operon
METMLRFTALTYVNELIRMRELYSILVILSRDPGENSGENGRGSRRDLDHGYVQTAVNLLISSYGKQIKVSDVAKAVGISRNYLDEIFKKEMGVSPKEFLMKYRIEKASSLLSSTSNPIGLIAEEVGYSDPMTFSKVFRSRRGMSPTEYREQHKKEDDNVKKVRLSI